MTWALVLVALATVRVGWSLRTNPKASLALLSAGLWTHSPRVVRQFLDAQRVAASVLDDLSGPPSYLIPSGVSGAQTADGPAQVAAYKQRAPSVMEGLFYAWLPEAENPQSRVVPPWIVFAFQFKLDIKKIYYLQKTDPDDMKVVALEKKGDKATVTLAVPFEKDGPPLNLDIQMERSGFRWKVVGAKGLAAAVPALRATPVATSAKKEGSDTNRKAL